jgi:RHS repeat-associated protein
MFQTTSARVLLLLAAGTTAGGWVGCSSQDKAERPREAVATTQQALNPSACDPNAPFDPPQPAFTGHRIANGLAFSSDGRKAYVSAKTTHSGTYAINFTQRDTTALPFAPLAPVTILNTGYEDRSPWLSSDGLTLYLTTYSAATSWQRRIAVATRNTATEEFNAPQLLPSAINPSGSHNQDAYFLSGQLYFASEFGGNSRNLYASPFSGTYGSAVDLGAVNAPDVDDQHPVLSPDGKTLYFASTRAGIGGDTNGDIWVSRRLETSDPFGSVTNLYGLNTSYDDFPVAIADNGCTLYFASTKESGHGAANTRLYRATRGASTPALVTTTLKVIGSGSVSTAPFQCSSTCSAQGAPDTTVMVEASGSAHWSGSCATQGGNPGSDAMVVFTKGGICTVDFRSPGAGTPGSLCFADRNCASGTYCVFGKCSTGADTACDPDAPFGPISQVFAGDITADGFTLSADEKTAYVSRKASTDYDIYVTTRNSTSEPFVALSPVDPVNSPFDDRAPWISDDGLRLYFWTKNTGWPGSGNLMMSSRNTIAEAFGAPEEVEDVNSSASDEDPFLLRDEKTLFFTSDRPTGDRDLWIATRSALTEPFSLTNTVKIPETAGGVNTPNEFEEERRPILTPDGLTLYFHSDREGWNADHNGDIFIAKRSSPTAAFGTPSLVEGVNYSGREFPVALSKDSCTLYFASNRDTGAGGSMDFRLYRASRCVPLCDGVAGGEYDGCGGTCPYDGTGNPQDPCVINANCLAGLSCISGVCVDRDETVDSIEYFIDLPRGTTRDAVALGSSGGPLVLADGARVVASPAGFGSVSSVNTSATTTLGTDVEVLSIWSQAGVLLGSNAHVHGDTIAQENVTLGLGATIDGNLEYARLDPIQHLSWKIPFPTNQGAINVGAGQTQTVSASAFASISLATGGRLILDSPGVYTVDGSLTIAAGAVLEVDNRLGNIQLYVRGGLTFQGAILPRDPNRNNVLVGVGADGPIDLDAGFRGVLIAPRADVSLAAVSGHQGAVFARSILAEPGTIFSHGPLSPTDFCAASSPCSALCPCDAGGNCDDTGECSDDRVCSSGVCTCGCDGKPCGASDGCGGTCTCTQGKKGCSDDDGCGSGLVCWRSTCVRPTCMLNPVLAGCGAPDSPCGEECTRSNSCEGDPDCGCIPNCEGKQCGDTDLSDGCGGRCLGVCSPIEEGCGADSDCGGGFICRQRRCRPSNPCLLPNLAPPDCGDSESLCGRCPLVPRGFPTERGCGTDPVTGDYRGACPAGEFCNLAGHCAELEETPPIMVPTPDGERPVEPQPSPVALGVGAIPGEFAVTESGSATYVIPIEVPPGRAGIQPNLVLAYSSSTANGTLGAGFSLDGLSSITRCSRTLAQDTYTQPVLGTPDDALCLDGQRLVQVEGTNEFRTSVDTFTKIVASYPESGSANPTAFTAHTKDGRVLFYGDVPSAQGALRIPYTEVHQGGFGGLPGGGDGGFGNIGAVGSGGTGGSSGTGGSGGTASGSAGPVIGTWLLSRVEDRVGNFMRITYRSLENAGNEFVTTTELVPDVITYTGHGSLDGDREVVFSYDSDREDQLFGWRPGGGGFSRSLRLNNIAVRAQGATVRTYALTYETVQHVSRLTRIQQCAGAGCPVCDPSTSGVCLPETVFEYYDEWAFEAPREFHPSYPGAYYNEGLNRYGLTRRVGRQDILDTFSVDTSVTTASPYWGLAAVGMSFIPYVGPFAASITNSLAEDQIDIEYRAWSFDIQSNRADGPFPTCGGEFPPTRQVIMGGTTTYLDVCPRYKETTEPVPMLAPNGQPLVDKQGNPYGVTAYVKRLYTPGVWMADVDGDGVQDKLFCDGESKLGYVLAKAYETGSSNPPTGAGHSDAIDIDAFGDLCKVSCAPKLQPCPRCTAHTAVCTADRVFSTIFDVDGDGTANLVVNDRKLGWAALVYDQEGVMSWRSDWFSALTIDANKTDYVEVLDVNGDGLRDLLALPAQASASTPPLVAFNTALGFSQLQLTPDGDATLGTAPRFKAFVTDLDHDGHDEIVEPMAVLATPNPEDVAPWRLRRITPDGRIVGESIESLRAGPGTMGDFDGDGNLDALTKLSTVVPFGNPSPYLFFKGSGRRQSLLKAVTDGRGHRIDVEYDGPGAIPLDERSETMSFAFDRTDPGQPSESLCGWPLRCPLASERPLVTAHTESHYLDGSFVASTVDRSYSYAYSGPMADMGGYGSLGFLARQVKVRDANNEVVHNSTTLYVEPQRFTGIPYIYTIVGRPHVQTAYSPSADAPLHESGWTQVVTRTEFDWREHTSSKGVPFPYLASRTLEVSDATDFGVPFYRIVETNDPPDAFGNITDQLVTAYDGSQWSPSAETSVQLHREFDPTPQQVEDWLVGLVGREVATSTGIDGLQRTRTRELEYYDNGLLHFVRREPGGAEELVRNTELIRDDFGNVRAVVSIDGSENVRESSTTYDERHLFPITQTNVGEGTSHTSEIRYDDRFGTVIAEADPNGIDATRSFDELGVLRRSTGPDGVGQFDYGPIAPYVTSDGMPIAASYRITSSREGGEATEVDLDSFGKPVRSKRAGLRGELVYEERGYDVRQRLVRARRPHLDGDMSQGEVTYQYDNLDRLTGEFYPDGAQVLHDYAFAASLASEHVAWIEGHPEDGAVSIQRIVGPFGTKVVIGNRGGQPTRVIDADGSDTFYFYRAFDALRTIWRNSDDQVILVDQDAYGRRTSMTDASRGGADTIAYNGLDEVVETNDAAGRVVSYFYDDFGRLEHSEAPAGQITQWVYGDGSEPNSIGRLVETISPSGQHITYGYELPTSTRNRGLLTRISEELIDPSALGGGTSRHFVTDYGYDNSSRLETIDYPSSSGGGLSVRYHFDDFGHVVKVSNEHEPTAVYWELVSADQGIRVHEERLGTAECGDTIGTTTQRDYYPTSGLLKKITTTCQGSGTLQDLHYVYEPGGNLYSRTNQLTGESETFGHDAVRRLTTVNGAERYSYDPDTGALASQVGMGTYVYEDDNPNWIKRVESNMYGHDAVGNIDSRSGPTVLGNAQTLEYTVFDLPSRVLGSGSVTAFQYDASESRVIKHDTVKGTTFYAGDLYQRVEELGVPGKERNWIYVGGRAVALVTNHDGVAGGSGSSTSRYLYDDHLGSIQTVAGGDGQVQAVRDYSPFGVQRAPSPMMDEVPLGFTGLEEDAELGLVNMNGRIYDPHLGQFLSADPIIQRPFGHGFNRFSYVHSSPLNFVDPSGFVPVPTDIIVSSAPQAGDMLMPALSVTPGAAAQVAPASVAAVAPAAAGASAPAGAAVFSPADAAILGQTLSSVGTSLLNVVRCLFTPSQVHSTNISVTRSAVSSSGGPAPAGRSGPDIFSPRTEPGLKAAQAATALPGQNPLVNTQLPSNDPNVRRYGDPSQLWGQKKTIKFIEELGREWVNSNPGPTRISPVLRIASISKQGGGAFGQHVSHVTGLDIDIMVIVDEAQPLNWLPTDSLPTNYSKSGTQSLVDAIHRVSGRDGGARVQMIFSSHAQDLSNVSRDTIHYNHIHVRLFP